MKALPVTAAVVVLSIVMAALLGQGIIVQHGAQGIIVNRGGKHVASGVIVQRGAPSSGRLAAGVIINRGHRNAV